MKKYQLASWPDIEVYIKRLKYKDIEWNINTQSWNSKNKTTKQIEEHLLWKTNFLELELRRLRKKDFDREGKQQLKN